MTQIPTSSSSNQGDFPNRDAVPLERRASPRARVAILLLLSINLLNYIDRFVLAAVEPRIREDIVLRANPAEQNPKGKTGLLFTVFLVSYMAAAPLFGWLAERRSRWALIAAGVALWSLASGASGMAHLFLILLITRCFVGIGEGAYGPVAPTIISDYFPVAVRGRVLSWFYMAIPVGGALGYALGGSVAAINRQAESWRWAFYLVVAPGLLLAVWAYLMRDPPRGAADRLSAPPRRATARDYRLLLHNPSYVLDTLGMTAMAFAMGAMTAWAPAYLEERGAGPIFGMQPEFFFGAICAVAGLISTLAGGMAGDALRGRFPGSYFLVSGVGMLVSVPCFLLFLVVPFPMDWLFVFLTVFFLFFNTGPSNTVLANVTHPSIRATAFAINILVLHLFGDAISPPIVGSIADRINHYAAVRLIGVADRSPAARAGLKSGDEIVEVGNLDAGSGAMQPVHLASDLDRWIAQRKPGDVVQIRYRRGHEVDVLKATLVSDGEPGGGSQGRTGEQGEPRAWLGALPERRDPGLDCGFALASLFTALGGVIWLFGARHLERDTAAAPLSLG
jgi:MFS family permease